MSTKQDRLKNLFKATKSLNSASMDEQARKVESPDYVKEFLKDKKRFFPDTNFDNPWYFARFGSAEQYYKKSIENIYKTYPYDGSLKEKYEWHNSSSYIDNYIFEYEYPRTNGYVILGQNWGTINDSATVSGVAGESVYKKSATPQYISIKGGPNPASKLSYELDATVPLDTPTFKDRRFKPNVYSSGSSQAENLTVDGINGNTVEFWLKLPDSPTTSQTSPAHAYFDLWNGNAIGSHNYGRFLIETIYDVDGSGDPDGSYQGGFIFHLSYASGSSGVQRGRMGRYTFPANKNITLSDWNHYAFVLQNNPTGSDHLLMKMYVNGSLIDTVHTGSQISNVGSLPMNANIGAYRTGPTPSLVSAGVTEGHGSLSGSSFDEFRFWKKSRNSEEIGTNWFKQVAGGTNSDFGQKGTKFSGSTHPIDLGVYFKFNEGISGITPLDSSALDYSGRVSNGTIENYNSSPEMRFVGSAIVSASAAEREFKDPILYKNNPSVKSYYDSSVSKGIEHDSRNTSAIYNMIPQWILDEDSEKSGFKVRELTQIVASHFDELFIQAENISSFKDIDYLSGSLSSSVNRPIPFANRLLTSKGFPAPELFSNADVLSTLANRDDEREYEKALNDVKNQLYTNIHNNFLAINKSKGTEKSIRNVLRSMGVDNEIYSINFYANNAEISLNQSIVPTTIEKNFVDFSHTGSFGASVYQSSASSDTNTVTFLTGSDNTGGFDREMGFTVELETVFPRQPSFENPSYADRFFEPVSASLFGMHSAVGISNTMSDVGDTSFDTIDYANFQVYAIKEPLAIGANADNPNANQVYFLLTSEPPNDSTSRLFESVASNTYMGVYDTEKWNFAVRVLPNNYPNLGIVSGSNPYTIEFHGYNTIGDQIKNSFVLTSSMSNTNGKRFLSQKKRIYVGAHRQNFTGSILTKTNTKISACRYWALPLERDELVSHAIDASNYGLFNPNENAYLFQNFQNVNVSKIDTLALNWEFSTITGSNSSGEFEVLDLSSGSSDSRYGSELSNLLEKSHPGRGFGFNPNITDCVTKDFLFCYKQQVPDNLDISDTVKILERDDEMFTQRTKPVQFSVSVEKSMYETISEEMLNFIASCTQACGLENLVGQNVNKYRPNYKSLEKVRSIFFEKIGNTPDLDKYLEYYKWLDSAISEMIQAVIPMSAGFKDIENVVESHILERSKYQHRFPTLEMKQPDLVGIIKGINELLYDWEYGHSPLYEQPHGAEATILFLTDTANSYGSSRFTIISTNGTAKRYIFDISGSPSTGGLDGSDVVVQVNGLSNRNDIADQLIVAINSSNGHNGGSANSVISLSHDDSTSILTLKQVVPGRSGNRQFIGELQNPVLQLNPFDSGRGFITDLDFNFGFGAQSINCNWWNKKALRDESYLLTGNGGVDYGRQQVHSASLQVFTRDFNKPYKFTVDEQPLKTRLNKRSVVLTELKPFDNSRSITFDTRTFVTGSSVCIDDTKINPNLKRKADYQVQLNDSSNTQTKYSSELISPYMFYSASINSMVFAGIPTGYQVGPEHLRDYYVDTKDVPMQGPFTSTHVGGNQHRNIGFVYKPVQINAPPEPRKDLRPEAWYALAVPAGGHLFYTVLNPSYFGASFTRADFTRDFIAKSPVNIKNIKTVTTSFSSSYGSILPIGNYSQNYEIVQIPDRSINNRYFVENNGISISPTASYATRGLLDYVVPDRGKHASIMVNRFSSPGGPEVNSPGYLDAESETFSVYNALPFRNLAVRQPLKTLLTAHSTFGGYSSDYGAPSASFHKTQRNGASKLSYSDIYSVNAGQGINGGTVTTSSAYDNYWVQHVIPQSDLQYSWITGSAIGFPLGYAQPDLSNASQASTELIFVQDSDLASFFYSGDAASAQISFNSANSDSAGDYAGDGVFITDALGNKIRYDFEDDGGSATGTSSTGAIFKSVIVQIQGMSNRDNIAAELVAAINHANGHNKGSANSIINLSYSTGTNILALTQKIGGVDGNTSIDAASLISNNCFTKTNFTGGANRERFYGIVEDATAASFTQRNAVSFAGLNTHFVDSLDTSDNIITTSLNSTFVAGGLTSSYTPADPEAGPAGVIGQAAKLNALNLKRNGIGGFSSWAQVRQSDNPLVKQMHNNNRISLVIKEPINLSTKAGQSTFEEKKSNYTEPVVSFRNKPLVHEFSLDTGDEIVLKSTYANDFEKFANQIINIRTGYRGRATGEEIYDDLKRIYIDKKLNKNQTSIDDLNHFKYKQTVYPRNRNVSLAKVRGREAYTVSSGSSDFNKPLGASVAFWKNNHTDRLRADGEAKNLSQEIILSASSYYGLADYSIWCLDAEMPFFDLYFVSGSTSMRASDNPYSFEILGPSGNLLDPSYQSRWNDIRKNGELSCASYIYSLLQPNLQGRARPLGMVTSSVPQGGRASGDQGPTATAWAMAMNKQDHHSLTAFLPSASAQYEFPNLVPSGTTTTHTVAGTGGKVSYVPSGNLCLIPPYRADVISERRPWFNSYEEYASDIRRIGQDYQVIPEFRVSQHIDEYLDEGLTGRNNNFLELIGSSLESTSSVTTTQNLKDAPKTKKNAPFFKLYSHTDFLKYFGLFKTDHNKNSTAKFTSLRMECHGIKKLLPYQGFYPATRATQLASLFSQSFGRADLLTGSATRDSSGFQERLAALYQPFFAPGIFFNSVKSGIAVSYPVHTGSAATITAGTGIPVTDGTSGSFFAGTVLSKAPNFEFPFEAILNPERYLPVTGAHLTQTQRGAGSLAPPESNVYFTYSQLTGTTNPNRVDGFYLQQSDATNGQLTTGTSSAPQIYFEWKGKSDIRYSLASHNFFAETENFFLEKREPTSFVSKDASKFEGMAYGTSYFMDVVLYKTDKFISYEVPSGSFQFPALSCHVSSLTSGEQAVLHNNILVYGDGKSALHEMNVRGMHYGPPYRTSNYIFGISGTGSLHYANGAFEDPAYAPHTPPYFYGEAVARIQFDPKNIDPSATDGDSRVFDLDEILSNAKTTTLYFNQNERATQFRDYTTYREQPAYVGQMQISSSLNLFGKVKAKKQTYRTEPDEKGNFHPSQIEDSDVQNAFDRWVIETKYESPSINMFGMDTEALGAGSPGDGRTAKPPLGSERFYTKGLWKGFGNVPRGGEGLYVELRESYPQLVGPDGEPMNGARPTGSLLQKCGFQTSKQRVGEVASKRSMSEAIIAIPMDSKGNFYKIDPNMFTKQKQNIAQGGNAIEVGDFGSERVIKETSISNMIKKMDKFYFPPALDFNKNPDIFESVGPYVMYVFEFDHTFSKEDLSYMWQNLMPDISVTAEKQSVILEHPVGSNFEFFAGTTVRPGQKYADPIFEEDTRWMVFKVKQRARNNFYSITKQSERNLGFGNDTVKSLASKGISIQDDADLSYSYNWPYDFCSLVELAKIDVEAAFTAPPSVTKTRKTTKNFPEVPSEPITGGGFTPDHGGFAFTNLNGNGPTDLTRPDTTRVEETRIEEKPSVEISVFSELKKNPPN
jgi:hypothetical protein